MKSVLSIALPLILVFGCQVARAAKPNIVFVLADDLGYGDVQALSNESTIPTPNLNGLAEAGITFTDAHSPSAVCTPTRYGLLTGRYCWRSRLKRGVLNGYGEPLIEPDRLTVASFLKQRGYTCGIVGKWHLGLNVARTGTGNEIDVTKPVDDGPNRRGFDFSYIIPASLDFPPYVYIHNGRITAMSTETQAARLFPAFLRQGPRGNDLVMEEVLDHLLEQAVTFIRRQSQESQPFFLYFPLTAPHKPVLPHPRFRGRTNLGPYGDFVVQVDWTVGEVLRTLNECGVANNTLVVFTSDNGSYMYRVDDPQQADHTEDSSIQAYRKSSHRANGVLRGTKADIWEAGHRVPFLVRWPGKVTANSRCDQTICLTDFAATVAELLGSELPEGAAEDSFSFLPYLLGKSRPTPRPPVIHHSAAGMFAIRDGQWKLVLGNGSGGREKPRGKPFAPPYQLFDLVRDVSEQVDAIARQPDIASRLEEACSTIRRQQSPDETTRSE
jgi:arylsulfatase A